MTCKHLIDVERAIAARGIPETFRGKAWSSNCREWVYFDCYIDTVAVRDLFPLASCVVDHSHRGTHDGQEHGLVCRECHDAIMGYYEPIPGRPVFKGESC